MTWHMSQNLRSVLVAAAFSTALLVLIRGLHEHDLRLLLTGIGVLLALFAWSTARLHRSRKIAPGRIQRLHYDRAVMRSSARHLMQLMFAALVMTWLAVMAALSVLLLWLAPDIALLAGRLDRIALDLLYLLAALGLSLVCELRWRKALLRVAAAPAHDLFSATRR